MPMFMCRWRNGDPSFVFAADDDDAIVQLDEWGNADHAELTRIKHFMVDLALSEEGDLKLQQFGEYLDEIIWTRAFPTVGTARDEAPSGQSSKLTVAGAEMMRKAVRTDKSRPLRIKKRKSVETETDKDLQWQFDAPASMISRYVKDAAADQLAKMPSNGRKQ